jgi:hypothetical protein
MGSPPIPCEIEDHQIGYDVFGSARKTGYCFDEVTSSATALVLSKLTLNFHKINLKKHLNLKECLKSNRLNAWFFEVKKATTNPMQKN